MASIPELIGQCTQANVKSGEALASVNEASTAIQGALASIELAKSELSAMLGAGHSETISSYYALLQEAENGIQPMILDLEQTQRALGAGMEAGETYIGKLGG